MHPARSATMVPQLADSLRCGNASASDTKTGKRGDFLN